MAKKVENTEEILESGKKCTNINDIADILPVDYLIAGEKKHSAEDYLVAILYIARKRGRYQGCCRAKELAEVLGVSRSSVSQVLRRLSKAGYVDFKPYARSITLTEKGAQLAQSLHARRIVVMLMADILGFTEERSKEIACFLEHFMNDEERRYVAKFICFMQNNPDIMKKWLEFRDVDLASFASKMGEHKEEE
ncbi:MarR family transcriptional regulator [bacterium 3DAC]|nr:metal-dependent transcriptional regulator [Dictyoglomota bacterium]UZN23384.1 MarR family transcriptional regulator [bacterium 3DAC]